MSSEFPTIFCPECSTKLTIKINIPLDPYNADLSYTLSCGNCKDTPQLTEKNVDDLIRFFMKQQISDLLIPFDHAIPDEDDSMVNLGELK